MNHTEPKTYPYQNELAHRTGEFRRGFVIAEEELEAAKEAFTEAVKRDVGYATTYNLATTIESEAFFALGVELGFCGPNAEVPEDDTEYARRLAAWMQTHGMRMVHATRGINRSTNGFDRLREQIVEEVHTNFYGRLLQAVQIQQRKGE